VYGIAERADRYAATTGQPSADIRHPLL